MMKNVGSVAPAASTPEAGKKFAASPAQRKTTPMQRHRYHSTTYMGWKMISSSTLMASGMQIETRMKMMRRENVGTFGLPMMFSKLRFMKLKTLVKVNHSSGHSMSISDSIPMNWICCTTCMKTDVMVMVTDCRTQAVWALCALGASLRFGYWYERGKSQQLEPRDASLTVATYKRCRMDIAFE